MSDGNYNRNILPYNDYRSGVRAGRSSERMHAVRMFAELIEEEHLAANNAEATRLEQKFREKLYEK